MGRAEQRHRHRMDIWEVAYGFVGMTFAFLIVLAGFAAGTYLAMNDHPVVGTLFSGGAIVSIVGAFIYGRSRQEKVQRNLSD